MICCILPESGRPGPFILTWTSSSRLSKRWSTNASSWRSCRFKCFPAAASTSPTCLSTKTDFRSWNVSTLISELTQRVKPVRCSRTFPTWSSPTTTRRPTSVRLWPWRRSWWTRSFAEKKSAFLKFRKSKWTSNQFANFHLPNLPNN